MVQPIVADLKPSETWDQSSDSSSEMMVGDKWLKALKTDSKTLNWIP